MWGQYFFEFVMLCDIIVTGDILSLFFIGKGSQEPKSLKNS